MGWAMKKKSNWIILFAAFLLSSRIAFAASNAATVIKETVDEVKKIVDAEKGKLSEEELDKKLRVVISPVFDFKEMARRSLAAHWNEASASEQTEFVDLFSDLLATNYIKKIRENIQKSNFSVGQEQSTGPESTLVRTNVLFEGKDVVIDYRLRTKDNSWKVYDVVIENIGLVSNYRSEFGAIIDKGGIKSLMQKLREKSK